MADSVARLIGRCNLLENVFSVEIYEHAAGVRGNCVHVCMPWRGNWVLQTDRSGSCASICRGGCASGCGDDSLETWRAGLSVLRDSRLNAVGRRTPNCGRVGDMEQSWLSVSSDTKTRLLCASGGDVGGFQFASNLLGDGQGRAEDYEDIPCRLGCCTGGITVTSHVVSTISTNPLYTAIFSGWKRPPARHAKAARRLQSYPGWPRPRRARHRAIRGQECIPLPGRAV